MTNRERRRAIGSEYLNYEFGWKPLVNDLKKISSSIVHSDDIMRQHERNSGKMVRRRYEFPESKTSVVSTARSGVSPWTNPSGSTLMNNALTNKGTVYRTHEVTKRQWFSGAFSYYVPPVDGSLRTDIARAVIQAKKTIGLSLTPDVLWNLAPWSWAVDWFSNTSDVLKNWTNWAIDNQVLMYGYMMETTISKYTYTFVGPTGFKSSDVRPPDVTLVIETKKRLKATPYGFGLQWDDMSSRQKAIVAALGLTKS